MYQSGAGRSDEKSQKHIEYQLKARRGTEVSQGTDRRTSVVRYTIDGKQASYIVAGNKYQ